MAARDQPGESEIVLLLLAATAKSLLYDLLDSLPQLPRNYRFVRAPVRFPVEIEIPGVDPVVQDLVNRRLWYRAPALPEDHARRLGLLGHFGHGVFAGRVPLEHFADYGRELWVRPNRPFPVGSFHIHVAQRRIRGPDALLGFFKHAFAGFFGQVVDIVLGHEDLDTVDEFFGGPGVAGEHDVLFDEVNLNIQAVDCDPVLEISVKPVRFLNQNDSATRCPAQKGDHFAEAGSATPLGCFNVSEFLADLNRVFGCVVAEQLLLRWD
jgi:hypothetical protein